MTLNPQKCYVCYVFFSKYVGKEWHRRTSLARHSHGFAKCKSGVCTPRLVVSGFGTEAVLTTHGCPAFAHVSARRQHAEARTAGCDRRFTIVKQARLLGLRVRSDLRWDDQVNEMVTKASKRLFFISRLRRSGVPTSDLATIYCGYIRPTLEYAAPCWSSALTQKQSDALARSETCLPNYSGSQRGSTCNVWRIEDNTYALTLLQAWKSLHASAPGFPSVPVVNSMAEICETLLGTSSPPAGTKRYTTIGIPALVKRLNEL
ncbi:hypothetical protein Bbelb_026100 [Branchiostoma belcheri]|nr:hypothetical protein Bbelb_026100 [Branchiostoma belcheri]